MFRKSFLFIIFAAFFTLAVHHTAYAQLAPLNGLVVLEKDGKTEPVANAVVELFRVEIKGFQNSKTNKKGEFKFAGIPYGEYVISVSAPNCAPALLPKIRAGEEGLKITMYPGDGRKYTEAEAKKGAAEIAKSGDEGKGPSDEDRKAQADVEKKNAEIEANNEKIKNADAIATKSNAEGYEALKAGTFDLAIAKFSEGIQAVPDFVDSTPIMLVGKMDALRGKGYLVYKEGATLTDASAKRAKWDEANKSYDEGLLGFKQAIAILKAAEPTTDPAILKRRETITLSLYKVATEIHRLKAVTGVDVTKIEQAGTVIAEYIAIEPDPAKKLDSQMVLGNIMLRAGEFAKAVEAYRQVLTVKPDHAEATGQLGLSLFGQASSTEPANKDMEQEGLNYMQKYIEMSPVVPTDTTAVKELKESIKQTVEYLKSEKKLAPQKVPAAPKRKN